MVDPAILPGPLLVRIKPVHVEQPVQSILLRTGKIDEIAEKFPGVNITFDPGRLWVVAPKDTMEEALVELEGAIFECADSRVDVNVPIDLQDALQKRIPAIQEETKTWIRLPTGKEPRSGEFPCPGSVIARIFGSPEKCQVAQERIFKWMCRRRVFFRAQYHHEMYLLLRPIFRQMGIKISSTHRSSWPPIVPTIPPPPQRPKRSDIYLWQRHRRWRKDSNNKCLWVIRARDEAGARRACEIIDETLKEICNISHHGYLVLPEQYDWNLVSLKEKDALEREMGVSIEVKEQSGCIGIIGSEENLEGARKTLLDLIGGTNLKRVDVPLIHVSEV